MLVSGSGSALGFEVSGLKQERFVSYGREWWVQDIETWLPFETMETVESVYAVAVLHG